MWNETERPRYLRRHPQGLEGRREEDTLVYRANLNFRIVKKYLKRFIDNGFLNDGSDGGIYVTIGKGAEFLEQYARLTIPLMPTGID